MGRIKTAAIGLALLLTPALATAQDVAPAPAAPAPAAAAPAATETASPAEAAAPAAPAQDLGSWGTKPEAGIGQPDGRLGLQDQITEVGQYGAWMHNGLLLPIITVISLFVLGLLLWVIVRYRASANPNPSKTSHNTLIEVVWTVVPVLILLVVAVPSIRLLAKQYDPPKADVTIKVTGNQWFWTYQYPDSGDFEIVSNMLPDEEAAKRGEPRMLAVDNRLVVPAGKTVKLLITAADVIHSFALPSFWVKMDAVPGRVNEAWFKVDREGVYYGQCSELCGAKHGYMPIAIEVVSPERYAAWVAAQQTAAGISPEAAAPAAEQAQSTAVEKNKIAAATEFKGAQL